MDYKDVMFNRNYVIYNDGRLFSKHTNRFLKPFVLYPEHQKRKGKKGYLAYKLCEDTAEKTIGIHKLVALHFVDNPSALPIVNHKDGDTHNNYFTNLEWCTHQQNVQHAFDIKLNDGTEWQGEKHSRSKLTNEEVRAYCERFSKGAKPLDLVLKTPDKLYDILYRIYKRQNWVCISKDYNW